MKKKLSKRAIVSDKLKRREQQVIGTLNEIIDTIEDYFNIAPFQWIRGDDEETGTYSFPNVPYRPGGRFYPWAEKWMYQLFPEARKAEEALNAKGNTGDEPGELAFAAEEFGFLCGFLVGAKRQGATRDDLIKLSAGFSDPYMQWYSKMSK